MKQLSSPVTVAGQQGNRTLFTLIRSQTQSGTTPLCESLSIVYVTDTGLQVKVSGRFSLMCQRHHETSDILAVNNRFFLDKLQFN